MVKDSEIKALLDNVEANLNDINKVDLEEIKLRLWNLRSIDKDVFFKNMMIAFGIVVTLSCMLALMLCLDFFKNQSEDLKLFIMSGGMLLLVLLVFSQFQFNKKLIAKIKREISEKEEKIKSDIILNGGNVSIASYVMSLGSPVSEEGKIFQAFYLLNNEKYAGNFIDLQEPSILDKDEMIMEIAKANAMFNKAKEIMKS